MDQAEAADPTFFYADPLQPGEVCLHSWMLYTSQVPVLDLTGEQKRLRRHVVPYSCMRTLYCIPI